MIQYALKCNAGHSFDSWFQSAAAFDKLSASGLVSCAVCGGNEVEKAVMTPRVSSTNDEPPKTPRPAPRLTGEATPAEQMLADLRRRIEESSDYVGGNFAAEARAMHLGEAPERSIYGEARMDEAKALVDEGIQIAPLPFTPNRKTN